MVILVIDVGGTHVKLLASNRRRPVKIPSSPTLTARKMVSDVQAAVAGWKFDAVAIGYPGVVKRGVITVEPVNLGGGWVNCDFRRAFGRPVRIINDAAMQALGAYRRGRMLFLGIGTGLGSALVVDGLVIPLELGHLPYRKGHSFEDYVGKTGLRRLGLNKWRRHARDVITRLQLAFEADDLVVGGGNAKLLPTLPRGTRRGTNADAFTGGVHLWRGPASKRR